MHNLSEHQTRHSLVSIYRDLIDGQSTDGYVLAFSDQLVVLQYVYDFHLDGLKVLRVADISEIDSSDTNEFQRQLMIKEGLEQQVPFGIALHAVDWSSVLAQLSATYPMMIIECEDSDENSFVIGRVVQILSDRVEMLGFAGNGSWDEEPVTLAFKDITCCQVGSNYLKVYERHFAS